MASPTPDAILSAAAAVANEWRGLAVVWHVVIAGIAISFADGSIARDASFRNRAAGFSLVVFGLAYPHFLETTSWLSYLYAAPFGLIPCPTLAVTAGVSLMFGAFGSRAWAAAVSIATLAYGLMGVVLLKVWIDVVLIAGGLLLLRHMLPVHERRLAAA